jgi:galactokinase
LHDTGQLARESHVAVVVAHDVKSLVDKARTHTLVPAGELRRVATDQEQRRIIGIAERLVLELDSGRQFGTGHRPIMPDRLPSPRSRSLRRSRTPGPSGSTFGQVTSNAENTFRVHAPGRVNLIGEHTDYTGGLAFPMAIDRGITLEATAEPGSIQLTSADGPGRLDLALPFDGDPSTVEPQWGSFVAGMAKELEANKGFRGHLVSDIPAGAGLSSSAALECAIGRALAFDGTPLELAQTARRAEHAATGVPTGIMDQLCIAAATEGHATLIDCHELTVEQVPVPDDIDVVVRFIAHRTLLGSAYAERVAECARAEAEIGPLRTATLDQVATIDDDTVRRRARHVVNENERVRLFAGALRRAEYPELGRLMVAGHASLRDDYDTSTAQMDAAVDELNATGGVFGARMTGGGFGGCLVAICEPGTISDGWVVRASAGARVLPPSG